ncbi:hypothetical protein GCM10011504_08490 [Siccirubricoccus deserti]|uniref:Uncharacterized protein n=1 Tax=Siccirubricoccus deserti TaxID=2013562 RepID=A0A9X0QV28_9PROT|nr:hypothetical protein [Siccirubricoccus deserti]MBC4014476.1 hypothetical protein [Siccirubricoccus deserti]GGC32593.1 hypothetical protein GCM10011504_08490 [Siccirubricoccus deserti]
MAEPSYAAPPEPPTRVAAWLLLAMSGLVSLSLIGSPGTTDVGLYWLPWMNHIDSLGTGAAYAAAESDYPPLSFVILRFAHHLGQVMDWDALTALKTTIFLVQLLSTGLVLAISGSPMLAAAFSAGVTLNGMGLAYLDLFVAPTLLGAFWALREGRPVLGTLLFGLSALTKWQPLLIAPFLAIHIFGIDSLRPQALLAVVRTPLFRRVALVAAGLALVIFMGFGREPLPALHRATHNAFLSANVPNLAWLEQYLWRTLVEGSAGLGDPATFMANVGRPVIWLHKGLFYLAYAATILMAVRGPKGLAPTILYAITAFLGYVILSTGVHENHLFTPLLLGFLLAALAPSPSNWTIAALLAAMANANLLLFYDLNGRGTDGRLVGIDLSLPMAVLFVAVWVSFMFGAARQFAPAGEEGRGRFGGAPRRHAMARSLR